MSPKMRPAITERQKDILTIIVNEYIRDGVAVSSENVAGKLPVALSPATVRSEISELEQTGYIIRPHASSGGLPSNWAYRLYVEALDESLEPAQELQDAIRERLRRAQDVDSRTRLAVQLLAQLLRSIAVATPPRAVESRWKHLQLVYLQDFLALLVIVLEQTRLKQQVIFLENPVTQDELTRVSNKLNAQFGGLTRREVAKRAVSLTPIEEAVMREALDVFKADEEAGLPDPYVDGLRHMFRGQDQAGVSHARQLAEFLEDRSLLQSVLSEAPDRGVVRVAIGEENKADLLQQFSVVFAQYGIPEKASGIVGIVGPTRMEYANAISHVRYLSELLSELVLEVHGQRN
jgi:heat-inducible transcriptional repressor